MDQIASRLSRDEVLVAAERQCTALVSTLERRFVEVATGRVLDEAAVDERLGRSGRGDAQALSGLDVRYRRIDPYPLADHADLPGTFKFSLVRHGGGAERIKVLERRSLPTIRSVSLHRSVMPGRRSQTTVRSIPSMLGKRHSIVSMLGKRHRNCNLGLNRFQPSLATLAVFTLWRQV